MITTLVSLKGGAGRTTLALNLAAASAASGASTLLIDNDSQATIHQAFERRLQVAGRFPLQRIALHCSSSSMLSEALPALAAEYDAIYIDTPAESDYSLLKLVEASDLALVPMSAGYQDLEITVKVAGVLSFIQAKNPQLVTRCIRNQWEPGTPIAETILRNLEKLSRRLQLTTSVLHHRPEFAAAFTYGASVIESDPESKAAEEVMILYNELSASSPV